MTSTPKTTLQAISIAWALLLAPAVAFADGFLDDDLDYRFLFGSDTEVYVSGLRNKSATHITIPSTVVYEATHGEDEDGNPIVRHSTCHVTSIGSSAFSWCSGLASATIPDSVVGIGASAFFGCNGLTSVTIPNSVTSIGESAFQGCSGLTSITIGNSVTHIGYRAFFGCSCLASVSIPESVESIGSGAFYDCSALTSVRILGNVTNDWTYNSAPPFCNCTNIVTLILGDKMTKIGSCMFSGCSNLTSVTIPDSVTSIENDAFRDCSGLTSLSIPDGVTNIGSDAFCYCGGLTNVTLPDSVMSIGARAFSNCWSLTSVTIPDSVTRLEDSAYSGCSGLTNVAILGNLTNDWKHPSVRGVHSPFSHCTNIATLVLGGKMTKIGNYMFAGCRGLMNVTLADSVTDIGDSAFEDCTGLTSLTIPDSVTSIGAYSFYKCRNLTCMTILGNVTNDWQPTYSPFNSCTNIATLVLGGKMTKIGNYMFEYCSGLTNVTIPNSVTSIGYEAFEGCVGLKAVTIPDSVTCIRYATFHGCSDLTSVAIPNSVTSIESAAFEDCRGLMSVTFKGTPPTVNSSPFYNVAPGARGYYTADHAAEWKSVIGEDGEWQGLIMEEVVPPVVVPPELQVQSANPLEGSLTLAWKDEGGMEGVTYSVYRSANDTYTAEDLVAGGLTGTSWTDTAYWSAEPVLKPLNYWVVADGGGYGERASKPVKTRNRLGVFVGLNEEQGFATDARLCRNLASGKGEFCDCTVFTGGSVDSDVIRGKVGELAEKAQPGDLFLLYIATHGGEGSLSMSGWLDDYDVAELQTDVRKFNPGVAVIGVVMACHSGSMIGNGVGSEKIISWLLDAGAADCRANIAWVTSCGYGQVSPLYGNGGSTPTPFGCSFLRDGWQKGYADGLLFGTVWKGGNGDGKVTFYELARYAAEFNKGYSDDVVPAGVRIENDELLKRIVAGMSDSSGTASQPDAPASCTASLGHSDASIQVNWELSKDATVENYWLFRKGPGETTAHCVARNAGNGEFFDPGSIRKVGESFWNPGGFSLKNLKPPEPFKIYTYYVRAVSPQGISEPSPEAMGFAGTTVMRQWLEALGISVAEGTGVASATMSANGHDSVLACYVAGLDPNDPNAAFTAELVREDGKWKAKPKGGEKEGRVYRVEGKKEMSDEFWTDVTTVEDLEAEGWHFFRLGVELAE